jgi:hypothetical protein
VAAKTEIGKAETLKTAELVRRCRWCELRLGEARYFLDGVWERVFSVPHLFGPAPHFTDGICPECFAVQSAEIVRISGANH